MSVPRKFPNICSLGWGQQHEVHPRPADILLLAQTTCGCLTASWSGGMALRGSQLGRVGNAAFWPGASTHPGPASLNIVVPATIQRNLMQLSLPVSYAQCCSSSCACGLQKPYGLWLVFVEQFRNSYLKEKGLIWIVKYTNSDYTRKENYASTFTTPILHCSSG